MMDKVLNNSEGDQARVSEGVSSEIESLRKGRRQFIKKTIVTVPVILTVTSRPVWASNCTWSGQLSGNLSDAGDPCEGEGCSADYWESNTDKWHYEFCVNKSFYDVFEMAAFDDENATLLQVIRRDAKAIQPPGCMSGKKQAAELAREAVAALQNSATGVRFELSVCDVKYYFDYYYQGSCDGLNSLQDGIEYFRSLNVRGSSFCQ